MTNNKQEIQPGIQHLLIVEGPTDRTFFDLLAKYLKKNGQLQADLQIMIIRGSDRNKLKEGLLGLMGDPLFEQIRAIGIVRDADKSARSAQQSIDGVLKELGLKAQILILPPNQEGTGQMLEDVLWAYFQAEDDPALACVEVYLDCLGGQVSKEQVPKTRFYSLLAAKEDPTNEDHLVFQRHVRNWDSPAFAPLRDFLRGLVSA